MPGTTGRIQKREIKLLFLSYAWSKEEMPGILEPKVVARKKFPARNSLW
jgi:hypothetical protein